MLDVGGSLGVGATARMCRNRKARTTPGAWSYFKPALAATMRCDGAAQCHGFCSILVYWRLLEPFFLSAAMFFFFASVLACFKSCLLGGEKGYVCKLQCLMCKMRASGQHNVSTTILYSTSCSVLSQLHSKEPAEPEPAAPKRVAFLGNCTHRRYSALLETQRPICPHVKTPGQYCPPSICAGACGAAAYGTS